MRRRAILVTVMLAGLTAAAAWAGDWPQWRGPHGDGISTETGLAKAWPADGPAQLWSVTVGSGYASPVVADGVLYIFTRRGGSDELKALDPTSGKELWSSSYAAKWDDRSQPGTRATPTIEGKFIYTYGGGSDLACWDRASGVLQWHVNCLKEIGGKPLTWGTASSPLIVGELIYVQLGKEAPTVVGVNKATGKIAWQSASREQAGYAPIVAVKVADSTQLMTFGGHHLMAIDAASGKTVWQIPYRTDWDVNAATPIHHDGRLFVTNGYSKAQCMMLRLAADGQETVWQSKAVTSKFSTPILENGYLYANSRGTIKCVRWADGEEIWASRDPALNLGIGGALVRVGDRLIAMSERGMLSLASATPEGIRLISQVQLFKARQIWATPLIYNGRLYAKGGDKLICLDIAAK